MSEKIEPALTLGDAVSLKAVASYVDELDPRLLPNIVRAANSRLPNSDRAKITRTWVNWLREEADVLKRGGAGAGALMATEIADGLERYLPPA